MQILLKDNVLDHIRANDYLKIKIAHAVQINGKPAKLSTVERWLKLNDPYLTIATILEVIRIELDHKETKSLLKTIQ